MSSERDINCVCALLKNVNVDYKHHHNVSIDEAHFSKVHLGFSDEAWMNLFKNYLLTRTEIRVDFSKSYQYQYPFSDNFSDFYTDPYKDMYTNLENLETYDQCLMDIECALRDFLEENSCQIVQYRDLTDARIAIEITHNKWVYMLREYMSKYHPHIQLNWCVHSSNPNEYCKCEIDKCDNIELDNIEVDVLKMICEYHSNRSW